VQLKIKSPEDFWSGMMFIGFGILAIVVSRDYAMGSAMRMGPGYFPTWLGGLLILMGAIIGARAFWVSGEGIKGFAWRPVFVLSIAFIAFGLLMDLVGFVPSLVVLVMGAALAGREFRWLEATIMTAVLIAAAVGVFIYGIGLPFRLFWW